MNTTPYLIITTGPTGSGKTELVRQTIQYLRLDTEHEKMMIDDIVQENEYYKQQIMNLLTDAYKACDSDMNCLINRYITNPESNIVQDFSKYYFETRRGTHCKNNKNNPITCDAFMDKKFENAIKENKNIVFETTGMSIPKWLLDGKFVDLTNYSVIFVYSRVSLDNLIQRNIQRAINGIKEFFSNHGRSAPRLPSMKYDIFKSIVDKIKNTLFELYKSCVSRHNTNICGEKTIRRLLIFDNNKDMHLIFDSDNEKLDNSVFKNKFINRNNNTKKNGGSRRKRNNKTKHK